MRSDRRHAIGINGEHTTLFPFFGHESETTLPYGLGVSIGILQERCIAFIGRVVLLDEVAHIDALLPLACLEILPILFHHDSS